MGVGAYEGPGDFVAGTESPPHSDPLSTHAEEIERLFRDHNKSLVSFLELRLRSRQEAREVAQEAYVRLLELERHDVTGFLRAYLFRIAANLAVDRLRRRATETRYQNRELFEDLMPRGAEPDGIAATRECLNLVRDYLDELPEPVRQAFLLFRLDNVSQEKIAVQLGITDRMVRNHVTRAMMYCRLRLDGMSRDDAATRLKDRPGR
jgi:RNA polymerase sigma-70 factor (ECF subfamily)